MKKNIIILILLLISFFPENVFAVTPTPTVSSLQDQVNELKNKIASRVAELNLVEKRGITGTVTDVSDTQITLSDLNGNTRFVDVDELTKFSSPSSKSFGISDITKGDIIGALGLYNKQSRRILARQISVPPAFPKIIFGAVGLIDKKNFELTVVKKNEQKVVIEVTDITSTSSYSSNTLIRSGFSKIKETQTVVAIGFPDKQDPNKIVASKIIILPDITISSINLAPLVNPTIPPSTGSGVKLYPLTK